MTEIVLKDKTYFLPEKWEELTPDQYLFLLDLLNDYIHNKITANIVAINFAMYVLKIKRPRFMSPKQKEVYYENLAWLGDRAAFWWVVEYEKPEVLNNVDPELRRKLKTTLPEDLPQTPEVRVISRYKYWLEPDFVFCSNLMPTLNKSIGYRFNMDDGLLSSSLSAGQFSDAMTISQQYGTAKKEDLLNLLCAILYPVHGNYKFEKAQEHAVSFKKLSTHHKQAIYINFKGILTFITQRTKFAILFNAPKKQGESTIKEEKITIGFNKNIYTLSKNGYGDTEQLMKVNLVTFLDLLLNELIDAVKSMQNMEMELDKILSATGLSLSQLKLITS
ncbi:hypothetical protein [Plebeiibacterium sediminum]|uniref:Uncharacterized protein n=1 Tax=Plebeiibacterium sediminum TaxID=2992112 RepID=A0AAE3M1E7_9BACT|nr:hypothetical protein [Plebeiobacterium sediminum]MCW3784929.1 hypothetical protein [Plebeiobacterium sediminum]